jgi:hypothetical protein
MKTTRNLWPLGIIGAFVFLFLGIATVIVIAATHRDSLVSDNYYENELKFQTQIDGASRAKAAGAAVAYDAATGQLVIDVPAGQLAQTFSGTIDLYRPSASTLDRQCRFEPGPDGRQRLDVSKLVSGPWLARVTWAAGGQNYFIELKFVVPK